MLLILSALSLLFLTLDPAAALLVPESVEIPYQINHSNRIVIGTVTDIQEHYDHTIFTITVEEWLYNPLPSETIDVRTEIGKYVWTEDQAEFTLNESVLLMLKDEDPKKQLFSVSVGFPGKRPVSDRDAVIEELKAQGKWQDENKTENTGPTEEQPVDSNSSSDTKSIHFTGILWAVAAVIATVVYAGKTK